MNLQASIKPAFWLLLFLTRIVHVVAEPVYFQNMTLTQARQQAKSQGKFLFVDVYTTWCKPCKEMEQQVFALAEAGQLLNTHFIAIRIDADQDKSAQVNALKVTAYPTMFYFHPDGKTLHRQEGALDAAAFLELTQGLMQFRELESAYEKNKDKAEAVYNYLQVLDKVNSKKAELLAFNYLKDVPEKKLDETLNWQLVQRFVQPTQRVLFNRVIAHKELQEKYPAEFAAFVLKSIQTLKARAIELQKQALIDECIVYLNDYKAFIPKSDSLQLFFQLEYAEALQTENLVPLLKQYRAQYGTNDIDATLRMAYDLVQDHFRKDVLLFAEGLADETLPRQPTALAYLVKAIAQERLGNFKVAYANLLLSYQYADEEITPLINEYEKKLSTLLANEFAEGVNPASMKSHDGRFTLGAGNNRLMYGFPVPESTSHFIVNINNKLASNASHLGSKVTQLKGEMMYSGNASTPVVTIDYLFENVIISQVLSPVDKSGKEITEGYAQYYKIAYTFTNRDNTGKSIGLGMLFDTMVDDNDHCNIKAGNRAIQHETKFSGNDIPNALQFYQVRNDTASMMGEAVFLGMNATRPDHVLVGRWPVLYNIDWKLNASNVLYGDSGYFVQWENRPLAAKGKNAFVTYYGLPRYKKPALKLLMKRESYLTQKITVYFNHESDELDLNAKMAVSALADNQELIIQGVMLNGYADVTGGKDYNFELSERRIDAVANILKARNISCIPKPYGLSESQFNIYNTLYGNTWDRRVDIIVYYKKKVRPR